MTTRATPDQLKDFEETVQRTAAEFPEDVVRIRHSFSYSWDGDPAIFFRVVLSDAASRRDRLESTTDAIEHKLIDELDLTKSEYFPYFYFRSKAEEDKLQSPEWA